jgi:hypothetical protein
MVSLFIFVSGIVTVKNNQELIFQLLFLPVVLYFLLGLFKLLTGKGSFLPKLSFDENPGQVIVAMIIFITLFSLGLLRIIL